MGNFYLNPNSDNETIIRNIGKTIRSLDPEKKWHVVVKLFKKKRSIDQNNYYWGVVISEIKRWLHDSRGIVAAEEALHDELKDIYCPFTMEQGMEGERKIFKSTADLSTTEFNEMTEIICADFAEKGLYIPPPDKNYKSNKAV